MPAISLATPSETSCIVARKIAASSGWVSVVVEYRSAKRFCGLRLVHAHCREKFAPDQILAAGALLRIDPGVAPSRACRREVDLNVRPSSQAVRPIFVHARRKRNAPDRSIPLTAMETLGGAATLLELFRKPE